MESVPQIFPIFRRTNRQQTRMTEVTPTLIDWLLDNTKVVMCTTHQSETDNTRHLQVRLLADSRMTYTYSDGVYMLWMVQERFINA